MNSLQKVFLLFVATLLLVALGVDRHSNLESFVAEPVQNSPHSISVRWTVADPNLVSEFELERRMGNNSTQRINGGCITQSGNTFECVDSDLFKVQSEQSTSTENVTYILHAINSDGRHFYGETVVEYTTNAVRRTWGSIKSMFQ